MNQFELTRNGLKAVREQTDEIILFYSGGRDSVVCLDLLAPVFKKVYCAFMYFLPGMDCYTPYLNWLKKYPNVELIEMQHWNTLQRIRAGMYNHITIGRDKIKLIKLSHCVDLAREKSGCDWVAFGYKKSDGISRNLFISQTMFDSIDLKLKKFYPISNWSQKNVENYITQKRLIKPVMFKGQRTNGIGVNENSLLFLRQHYPNDLQKILEVFPLAGKILYEYDYRIKHTPTTEV
jgi:sulfate adenylyltransferase subunit 2